MDALFLGNSYTFYNDVPGQVAAMAQERGVELRPEAIVEGGADWSAHATRLGGLERIAAGPDVVILQGRSTDPLLEPGRFERYGRLLGEAAIAAGARVVLFQTWAWAPDHDAYRRRWSGRSPEAWLAKVREAYDGLARDLGATVAPVGEAWARARREHPSLDLHDADRHHASPLGSHLAACVLLRTLTSIDPREVGARPPEVGEEESRTLKSIAGKL